MKKSLAALLLAPLIGCGVGTQSEVTLNDGDHQVRIEPEGDCCAHPDREDEKQPEPVAAPKPTSPGEKPEDWLAVGEPPVTPGKTH